MPRPAFLAALAAACAVALPAAGQSGDPRWDVLSDNDRIIIDRLAADFYEESLRHSQSSAIEDHTSEMYANADPAERARFIAERREAWEEMTPAQRDALRGVKRPSYRNLAEEQKAPFRSHALDRLGAVGAVDEEALADALGSDI